MDEQEKREVEEKIEEKKKDLAWWQKLNPLVLFGAGMVLLLIFNSAQNNPELKKKYLTWGAAIFVLLYLMSKTGRHEEKRFINAREAKILVAKECEFNKRCNEYPFTTMSRCQVGPVNPWRQNDATGKYCDVAVRVWAYPTDKMPFHFVATVITMGEAMGCVYFTESVGPLNGRESRDKAHILPPKWVRYAQEHAGMDRILFRGRGGEGG